jgi:A/G-specific adenine glycosylase
LINNINLFSNDLLNWYDQYQRQLPWRSLPNHKPNPYHVFISEVMLQQTTVPTVIPYFQRFIAKWPTLTALSGADLDEIFHMWQGLGYYSRARNLHKCAQSIVAQHAGRMPDDVDVLLKLPGIGPYTAAAIASIAYDQPVVPVDGNVIRVFARLNNMQSPLPGLKDDIIKFVKNIVPIRPGEFAQALMDLGSGICRPKSPSCPICPVQHHCTAKDPDSLPNKLPKVQKPTRYGVAYWIEDKIGRILIQKRPDKGLLAGLMGFPTSEWLDAPPVVAIGTPISKIVRHTFTHFHLHLSITQMPGADKEKTRDSIWVHPSELDQYALPTLMKKVAQAAMESKMAAIGENDRR